MGRHFEVRAASMAASAAKKSAIYMRASKEIYVAAKSGTPDPNSNLALRTAIEKYRKTTPKDVIDRAIKKAQGTESETYISGRYEAFGPGGSFLIIDTLTDNVNRALVDVRTAVTRKGGHLGSVAFNFEQLGIFDFYGDEALKDAAEEALIMNDVDLKEISLEDGIIEVIVGPSDFAKAKDELIKLEIPEFEQAMVAMIPNDKITLEGDDVQKFRDLLDSLDEVGDVQEVYHNVNL
ncbi:MAG: YebC/PmpR family DNA-binding transcriptional regulator [Bacilli bacterium]